MRIKFGVLRAAEEMLGDYRVSCGRRGMALAPLTGRQEAPEAAALADSMREIVAATAMTNAG